MRGLDVYKRQVYDIRKAMKESKGTGKFRNLFVYEPGRKKGGMQIIR